MTEDPYRAPAAPLTPRPWEGDPLSPEAVELTTNLVDVAQQAIAVGLIPILGLIFVPRLIQWYHLRDRHPDLLTPEAGGLGRQFRSALPPLWFAVLLWPGVVLAVVVYAWLSSGLGSD